MKKNEWKKWLAGLLLICVLAMSCVAAAGAEQSDSWILEGYTKVDTPIHGTGFILPAFTDQRFGSIDMGDNSTSIITVDQATGNKLVVQYFLYGNADSKENREDALAAYDEINSGVTKGESGILEVQGHPALYTIIEQDEKVIAGILDYVRNLYHVKIKLLSYNSEGNPRKITVNDMTKLAELLGYDENDVEIKQADGTPVIATEEETHVLTAGKKKDFWCNYANGFAIKYNPKLDVIEWSVVDAETGEAVEGVKISAKGQLTADKSINQVKNVKVVAYNPVFHASGEYEMTVIPAVKKVSTDPAEVFLYEGSDATVTVLAVLDPDTVPLTGITWTLKKEGIAEMNAADDGTATFKAQAAGKTQVTVKEPGGKSAVLKVNVVEPVTEVTLSAKGKAAPGKTVTVSAALEPKKAGNKNLEWSLDVDETVATINAKGQVKIAREAAAGTVITVTCKALGAPEPVVSALQITVE